MIQIKPFEYQLNTCSCGNVFSYPEIIWQGLHICEKFKCTSCGNEILKSLPVNQSILEQYTLHPGSGLITDNFGKHVALNWYSKIMLSIIKPLPDPVEIDIEILRRSEEVIILNTLDQIYGHSLYFLLNLQRIIALKGNLDVVVVIQPMLRWLIPPGSVAEIWTVRLGFKEMNNFYPDLSEKINKQLNRFKKVSLSRGHIIPANSNILIERFSGIKPFSFAFKPAFPRVTFIWREDPDRLWIRNIYLLKGLKKLGISKLLLPVQYLRVRLLFLLLKGKLNGNYKSTIAGMGRSFRFSGNIDDRRISKFDTEAEKMLCRIYAESELVIGVHGSSMILPSAHAGMVVSLMPSKRWGNFGEDILYVEDNKQLAAFQRRIIPLNLSVFEISDIASDMLTGRDYYIRKFIHSEEL